MPYPEGGNGGKLAGHPHKRELANRGQ